MKIDFFNNIIDELDEKIILICLVGVFESLKNESLSIDEAEKFLFSPNMIAKLQTKNCNAKIINILKEGCELEDIVSLIPHRLFDIINDLEQRTLELVEEYKNFEKSFWINE